MSERPALLEARGLVKEYRSSEVAFAGRGGILRAVDGVSLSVRRGETLGIVGESGCGKSTVARLLMALEQPTAGEVLLEGRRIDGLGERRLRKLRPRFQMVFQDPASSLNPRKPVGEILAAPMRRHRVVPAAAVPGRIAELLETVGLPADMASRYPHTLSGGQKQRVSIARALSLEPELLVLDEPVSALDVSVQAQVCNLLRDLQQRLGLTFIFIGHGLATVHYVSDRIAVMYMGRVLEQGPAEALFRAPAHPYTRALLDAAPSLDPSLRGRERIALGGEPGQTVSAGCRFRPRCPFAREACATLKEELLPASGEEHLSACPFYGREGA